MPLRGNAVCVWLLVLAGLSWAHRASAATEFGSRIAAGIAGTGDAVSWSHTKFYGALRGEALFGSKSPMALRLGPSLELGTVGFSDFRVAPGATLQIPLDEILALALTPGAYVRTGGTTVLGLSSRAFFGVHPYNRVGSYGMSGGLVLGLDRDLGAAPKSAVVIGLEADGMLLVLPALLLVEWIRGPRE